MQPDLQIARAYTPLPPLDNSEPEQLRLLVRQEPQGEVSTMLHKISRGTFVHMRGPHVGYEIPEDVDEILFIAGGTGIAPALQVAHTLYKARQLSSDALPRMRILWANRRREDSLRNPSPPSLSPSPIQQPPAQSPLVQEIEVLRTKFSGNVAVDYFVDEEGSYITEGLLRDYLSRVQLSNPPHTDSRRGKNIILVSGPDGFVNFYAGPKSMKSGKELQGPLGGMLQKISPDSWDVWKL
ncbi:mitochondrial Homoaconitase [Puttea exsequens]|nr:mitochondrial Homoaconitase [Puttea exsequens]